MKATNKKNQPAKRAVSVNKKKAAKKSRKTRDINEFLIIAVTVVMSLFIYAPGICGFVGEYIRDVFLGLFGISAYLIPPVCIAVGIHKAIKRDDSYKVKYITAVIFPVVLSCLLDVFMADHNASFYIPRFYYDGIDYIGGGVIGGLLGEPLVMALGSVVSAIVFITAMLIMAVAVFDVSIVDLFIAIGRAIQKAFMVSDNQKKEKKVKQSSEKEKTKTIDEDFDKIKNLFELNLKGDRESASKDSEIEPVIKIYGVNNDEKVSETEKGQQQNKSGKFMSKEIESVEIDTTNEPIEYEFPPISLLNENPSSHIGSSAESLKAKAIKLVETLRSFGVETKILNIEQGPAVTRFELQPSVGVKVSKITNLADDIALNLAAQGVRIEAPIPGKAAVGIEIPNDTISSVFLKDVVDTKEFRDSSSKIAFALGKDISGKTVLADIAKMPHLLIAGQTGAGKSVCINTLITSILYKANPNEVKFLMIDPKVVELKVYNGIPHLLIPVVTEPKKAAGALNWAVSEMVNRYKLFADNNVRDLRGYNQLMHEKDEPESVLPQIVIIIDELADLMMVSPREVEDAICRLAQLARAAGMHLVIATQRPSVDVITGIIKANIPSRISFAVSSQIDSRTILDMAGAEKLLGKGDMLFFPTGESKPIRVQGSFVSDKEVERLVEFVKGDREIEYNDDIIEKIENDGKDDTKKEDALDADVLLNDAIEFVVDRGEASTSMLQRKFRLGYSRAARIVDQMEERGIVSPPEGSKPRKVLITRSEWLELQMSSEEE